MNEEECTRVPPSCLRITGKNSEKLDKRRLSTFLRRDVRQNYKLQYECDERAAILKFTHTNDAEHAFCKLDGKQLTRSGAPIYVEYETCEDTSSINHDDTNDDESVTSSIASEVSHETGSANKLKQKAVLRITAEDKYLQTSNFTNVLDRFAITYGSLHVHHDKNQSYGSLARVELSSMDEAIEAENKLKGWMMGEPAKVISIEITSHTSKRRNKRRKTKHFAVEDNSSLATSSLEENMENQLKNNGTSDPDRHKSKTRGGNGENTCTSSEMLDTGSNQITITDGDNESQPVGVEENKLEENNEIQNDDDDDENSVPEEAQIVANKSEKTSTSVLVRNIPEYITKEDIHDFLLNFDLDIQGMQFRRTYAVVQFQYPEEATEAWTILRKQSSGILGDNLEVKFIRNSSGTHEKGNKIQDVQQNQNKTGASTQKSNTEQKQIVKRDDCDTFKKRSSAKAQNLLGPNDVVIDNLPRSVDERDIAKAVLSCPDEARNGFIDARQTGNKAILNFKTQQSAFEAVAELRFVRVKGHTLNARLAVQNPDFDKLMYRKQQEALIAQIKETEKDISLEIEGNMARLLQDIMDIENALRYCETRQEVDRLETTKNVLQNKLDENQRYYEEFKETAVKMTKDLDNIIADELEHHGRQHALLQIDDSRRRLNREGRRLRNPLPIYGRRTEILNALTNPSTRACVIQAETGSGKSTQVPQYLMEFLQSQTSSSNEKGIVCTQPRRVAAITLAQRIAEEYDCEVGHEVGFIAGNKKKVSDKTMATFMTDRTLLNFCLADSKYVENYRYVIIDEAHERSVDTDILLAMLKKEQIDNNKHFTIIIMSATIDVKLFSGYFDGCPVIEIHGRTFPVDIEWCSEGQTFGNDDYVTRAVEISYDIHINEDLEGDILVFLTSQFEIDRACRNLRRKLGITQEGYGDDNAEILPLHGKLQPNDQFKVFRKTRDDIRKIVFATNIAETSVTIPGVKYVIDTGMVKELQYDTRKSMSMLKVTNVTQASAEQRKGRAGRTGPGKCYRLYSHEEFQEMDQSMKPEILRVHLGMTVMKLLQMGVRDVDKFNFVESPEPGAIEQAMKTLILLGAVNDEDRTLTDVGNQMVKLPVEPRLAKLILEGAKRGVVEDAIAMAALVSAPGNVFFQGGTDAERKVADQLKLPFCVDDGDVITLLGIFKEWQTIQGDKAKNRWCKDNSLNAKTLRIVQENVDELDLTIKRSNVLEELNKSKGIKQKKSKDVTNQLKVEIEEKRNRDEDGCQQKERIDLKESCDQRERKVNQNDESYCSPRQLKEHCNPCKPNGQPKVQNSSELIEGHSVRKIHSDETDNEQLQENTSMEDKGEQFEQQSISEENCDPQEVNTSQVEYGDDLREGHVSKENSNDVEMQTKVKENSGNRSDANPHERINEVAAAVGSNSQETEHLEQEPLPCMTNENIASNMNNMQEIGNQVTATLMSEENKLDGIDCQQQDSEQIDVKERGDQLDRGIDQTNESIPNELKEHVHDDDHLHNHINPEERANEQLHRNISVKEESHQIGQETSYEQMCDLPEVDTNQDEDGNERRDSEESSNHTEGQTNMSNEKENSDQGDANTNEELPEQKHLPCLNSQNTDSSMKNMEDVLDQITGNEIKEDKKLDEDGYHLKERIDLKENQNSESSLKKLKEHYNPYEPNNQPQAQSASEVNDDHLHSHVNHEDEYCEQLQRNTNMKGKSHRFEQENRSEEWRDPLEVDIGQDEDGDQRRDSEENSNHAEGQTNMTNENENSDHGDASTDEVDMNQDVYDGNERHNSEENSNHANGQTNEIENSDGKDNPDDASTDEADTNQDVYDGNERHNSEENSNHANGQTNEIENSDGKDNPDEEINQIPEVEDEPQERPHLEEKRTEEETNTNDVLRKILMSAYFENLSVFNGHIRAGYTVASQLKPQSSIQPQLFRPLT
ncbi:uncharacterized protein [Amphiura filiformis]|uniref:uncharacterized protein n=1 Tax=Amphiura filiformis TaxID=82378 RepID=UPI003B225DA7